MRPLTIRQRAPETVELLLYDVIGADLFGTGILAKDVRAALQGVRAKTLNLRINSPGGSVFETSAILAALDEFPGRIEVDVDGLAASAASVLAMAGDTIRIAALAMIMIHDPYAVISGGAEDLRSLAAVLDATKEQILDVYLRHARASRAQLSAWMTAETWFTGAEAVAAGLAQVVTEGRSVAACAHWLAAAARLGYRHMPAALQDRLAEAWAETRRRQQMAETWCAEAVAAGLAQVVTEGQSVAACAHWPAAAARLGYRRVPSSRTS